MPTPTAASVLEHLNLAGVAVILVTIILVAVVISPGASYRAWKGAGAIVAIAVVVMVASEVGGLNLGIF